jgi:hypothetical protein
LQFPKAVVESLSLQLQPLMVEPAAMRPERTNAGNRNLWVLRFVMSDPPG